MVRAASKRNRGALARGRVSVRKVNGTDLGLAPASFDRIFSVHSIYFWKEPERVIAQLGAALRPGGRVVLAFLPDTPSVPNRFRDPVYRFYSPSDVMAMFKAAGFAETRNQNAPNGRVTWVIAQGLGASE
jgi:SAM-dependent methyltransferase